ncbi:MAG TPA: type II toxin-antitoxin system RelE/ParE family toxin, partial [Sphingomonas sp.]|nr:type II toxin-antitoxin system RelE/ParE family toxin [Sphingomonas sp.]
VARRKLRQLDGADRLDDMRAPPGNRLEELKGDRKVTHSVRFDDQWRITFRWSDGGADDVPIEDYHR